SGLLSGRRCAGRCPRGGRFGGLGGSWRRGTRGARGTKRDQTWRWTPGPSPPGPLSHTPSLPPGEGETWDRKEMGSSIGVSKVVSGDDGHEVLDFLGSDIGEGEGLDGAGVAGARVGDGASVLERPGERRAGADFDGAVFLGERGDALQEIAGAD